MRPQLPISRRASANSHEQINARIEPNLFQTGDDRRISPGMLDEKSRDRGQGKLFATKVSKPRGRMEPQAAIA